LTPWASSRSRCNAEISLASFHVVQECVLCGRPVKDGGITEQIDGRSFTFDGEKCAMMFKRFASVYGSDFLADIVS
jgi:hypothetical protein